MIFSRFKKYAHVMMSLVLACLAGLGVYYYVNLSIPSQKVIVSAGRIPVGTTITSQMLRQEVHPKSSLPGDAISNPEEALGRTVTVGILENSPVREGHLVESDQGRMSVRLKTIAPGKNAVDLPPETSPGLFGITIGDVVEIYTETGVADETGRSAANRVEKVAENAIVLSTPYSENDSVDQFEKGSFIVAVTPEEEEKIADGIVRGKKFTLFLLPPGGGQ